MRTAHHRVLYVVLSLGLLGGVATPALGQDRLCDPGGEDCRSILLDYIRNETVGIDVAFWFMEDARYTAELIRKHNAGVTVRVLIDPRANASYPLNADRLQELQAAGIPMRKRLTSYILHWKMMLFHGQNAVEFSGANFSANAWRPNATPNYSDYVDEAIYFTSDGAIVNSFRTEFDDQWVDDRDWANYANISAPLTRRYDIYPKDPSLNFPPAENFRTRSVTHYRRETRQIDVIMYRITDRAHADNILPAVARGITVRLITEPAQYRLGSRMWHAWNVDRLYMGGVRIKHRQHLGLNHQKSVILYDQSSAAGDQSMAILGSSNWTSPSASGQLEHNLFTTKPYVTTWLIDQFERKWNNTTGVIETVDFVPLPPDAPKSPSPATGATGVDTAATLRWIGGPWAHLYDVYLDTTPNPTTLVAQNLPEGSNKTETSTFSYTLPATLPGSTRYYWRVVGKTMALQGRSSPVWSFTTAAAARPTAATLLSPVSGASAANPIFTWRSVATATHYYLWINDSTGTRFARWYGGGLVGCQYGGGTCSVAPHVPLRPGTITWWIQTWNAEDGYGPWSSPATYTLRALATPTLIGPSGALPQWPSVPFRWYAVPGATHYYLWVTDGSGVIRVQAWYDLASTHCASQSSCSLTLQPALSAGTATWWIQAWNATAGYSPWSTGLRIVRP